MEAALLAPPMANNDCRIPSGERIACRPATAHSHLMTWSSDSRMVHGEVRGVRCEVR